MKKISRSLRRAQRNLRKGYWKFHLPTRLNKKKIWRYLLYGIGAFFLFVVFLFVWYSKDLPTPEKLAARRATESTKIFDRNGDLLYTTGEKRRTVIEDKDMPVYVRQATVAIEDKDFYKHHGLDFSGIFRAVIVDITSGSRAQGGSTITQQFVKNALLSPKKTFTRKIKEAILSIELEQTRTKEEILTLYLNEIPYGGNVYGIEEASKYYFDKSAKDITLSEAATLAALPQAPTYYSPFGTHSDALFARKTRVLDGMVSMGYITQEQADEAKAAVPNSQEQNFVKRRDNIKAPHFVLYVREQLVELYGEQMVNEGGLQVTTTLNSELQEIAQSSIDKNFANVAARGGSNAALVSVDPKTGQILSMIGSKDYFDTENDGNVNVTLAKRQPGSSFKPIAYATAFKGQYNPASTIFDLRTDFGGGYVPANYNGRTNGPVSIRYALANSLNIPAVKILSLAGIENTIKTARDLGITTLTDPDRYGLALVLGGGEVKPLEMAGAYGTFGNNGKFATTTPFLKIQESNGKTIYEYEEGTNVKQALDPQIAYEITDILADNDVRRSVFGNALAVPNYRVAVKTGTTQEFRDGWTAGYTPNLATVVWVGNNDNTKMKSGADGSVVAAPIFRSYMAQALSKLPKNDFERPSGIQEVTVEKFSNKLPTEHSQELIKDIFAQWQVPTKRDDVNVVVKVNRLNGQLATDSTPPELIEERVYRNIHSERPTYPNWEGPVRAWAEANGFFGRPPQDQDTSYDGKQPTISIITPAKGTTYNSGALVAVSASASAGNGIREVVFTLGNQTANDSSAPYSANLSTAGFAPADYTLTATVYDNNGVAASVSTTIVISASSHSQSNITTSNITSNSAMVSFNTSLPTTAFVRYGLAPASLNLSKSSSVNSTSHSIVLTGLTPATQYHFQVVSTAGSSTITSSIYNFTTLP